MIKLVKKLIEWAFFKFVYEPEIILLESEDTGGEDLGFEIIFEPDPTFLSSKDADHYLDAQCYSHGGAWDLAKPSFDNEIDAAMYEKKKSTVH